MLQGISIPSIKTLQGLADVLRGILAALHAQLEVEREILRILQERK